jgi:hypothetical protein
MNYTYSQQVPTDCLCAAIEDALPWELNQNTWVKLGYVGQRILFVQPIREYFKQQMHTLSLYCKVSTIDHGDCEGKYVLHSEIT